ncbi:MAG TPA: hypothetical protein VFO94_12560 [Gammaproteobacteria bacterium]|nr:hypothetical protein [Gammaproteobacteria bacterium]
MTRAMTNRTDNMFWDFVYQATIFALGVTACVAVVAMLFGL